MSDLAYVAFSLHTILFMALVAVCAFDDGRVAHDWTDCLIPLRLLLVPFALAVIGIARRSAGLLTSASVVGVLLGLVSLTGPGLFVPACNNYDASVDIEEDSFGFVDGFSVTEMACAAQVMDSEDAYLDALFQVDTIARTDNTLVLTGPDTSFGSSSCLHCRRRSSSTRSGNSRP